MFAPEFQPRRAMLGHSVDGSSAARCPGLGPRPLNLETSLILTSLGGGTDSQRLLQCLISASLHITPLNVGGYKQA